MFKTIFSIMHGTPLWVYLAFGYLLFIGLRATKARTVALYKLFILPAILNAWSLTIFINNAYALLPQLTLWVAFLSSGIVLGLLAHGKRKIIVDRSKRIVHIPGSWLTFILVMAIFVGKYYFGYSCATASTIAECATYKLYNSYFSAFASGILLGNVLHVLYVYLNKRTN